MSNNIIIGWHIYLHKVYATPRDRTAVLSLNLRKNYNKLVFNVVTTTIHIGYYCYMKCFVFLL